MIRTFIFEAESLEEIAEDDLQAEIKNNIGWGNFVIVEKDGKITIHLPNGYEHGEVEPS